MPRKVRRYALPPAEYKALCDFVHKRDNWRCRNPKCRNRNQLHNHHIVFRSQGGGDTMENCITLCDPCHTALHGHLLKVVHPSGDESAEIDAGRPVKFVHLGGWSPGRKL